MIASSGKAKTRRKLVSELDGLVRTLVFARDGHQCVRCGKTANLQAAHIFPKGHYPRLRFDLLNVLTLCVGCHLYCCHKDPLGFSAWLDEKYPLRRNQLQVIAATAMRVDMKLLRVGLRYEVEHL